jgi:hypothetical protein
MSLQENQILSHEKNIFYFHGEPGSLVFAFFSFSIGIYLYIFIKDKNHNLNMQIVRRWWLGINTICFLVLLFLLPYSFDSYMLVNEKGVIESYFWQLGDQHLTKWDQLKQCNLIVSGDEENWSVQGRLVFQNGKTYELNPSSMDQQKFVNLIQYLHKLDKEVAVTKLTTVQKKLIYETYGKEMLSLFQQIAHTSRQ